jgi:hypothetical protein
MDASLGQGERREAGERGEAGADAEVKDEPVGGWRRSLGGDRERALLRGGRLRVLRGCEAGRGEYGREAGESEDLAHGDASNARGEARLTERDAL